MVPARRCSLLRGLVVITLGLIVVGVGVWADAHEHVRGHVRHGASLSLDADALYKDAAQPIDLRVKDLVERMTLDEKVAQLTYAGSVTNASIASAVHAGGVGGLSCADVPANCVTLVNRLQAALKKSTRLGIPASIYAETTHSGGVRGSTVFPMPVTTAASWNRSLLAEIGAATALELRSAGGDQGLSPILQVCTDPRFGRMEENFGEDPYLVGELGAAATRGMQGAAGCHGANTSLPPNKVASQAKHFAVYGAGGRDGYTPMGGGPSQRTVFEVYLKPWWKYAAAGGRGVMLSHNMALWEPMHANKRLVTDVLRNRFGLLGGYVGSDMGNVRQLQSNYGFASTGGVATKLAMEAGLDQNMGGEFVTNTKTLVLSGALANTTLDRAVGNILRKKFASGLFDMPPTDPAGLVNVGSAAHRELSRDGARQGLVLLINRAVAAGRQGALPCFTSPLCPDHHPHPHSLLGAGGGASRMACPTVLDCRNDSVQARMLPAEQAQFASRGDGLTLSKCAAACAAAGYDRAGTEYGHECWCGHSSAAPDAGFGEAGCTAGCDGDQSELCSGSGRMTELAIVCRSADGPPPPPPPPPSPPPLPASPAAGAAVAVIGQLGGCGPDDNSTGCIARMGLLGGYSSIGTRVVTIEDAFNARGFKTSWVEGVAATDGQTRAAAAPGIAAAVAAVAATELTVLAVGCVQCSCCNRCGCGEAGDRQSFDLEGQQLALMDAVLAAGAKLGKLVVVVTVCGRPVTFSSTDFPANSILDRVEALIAGFRPGEEGGSAIADVILGDHNPGGRLALNWLRNVGQVYSPANPWYQMRWGAWFPNGDGTRISPLFQIGAGESYTRFNVTDLRVPAADVLGAGPAASAAFNISARVSNTGGMAGDATIFVTYSKQTDGVARWEKMLCGFEKLHVAVGTTVAVTVPIQLADLTRWDPESDRATDRFGTPVRGAYVVDGGPHTLQVDQCIDTGVSYGETPPPGSCTPLTATVLVGEPGKTYIVL